MYICMSERGTGGSGLECQASACSIDSNHYIPVGCSAVVAGLGRCASLVVAACACSSRDRGRSCSSCSSSRVPAAAKTLQLPQRRPHTRCRLPPAIRVARRPQGRRLPRVHTAPRSVCLLGSPRGTCATPRYFTPATARAKQIRVWQNRCTFSKWNGAGPCATKR